MSGARLIDANKLREHIVYADISTEAVDALMDALDAVPVVKCDECRHWKRDRVRREADARVKKLEAEVERLKAASSESYSDRFEEQWLEKVRKKEAEVAEWRTLADERWEQCKHEAAMRREAEAAAEEWNAANIAASRTIDSLVRERRTLRKLKQRAERERDDVLDEVRLRRRELEAGYAVQKRLREERDALKCCGNCRHSDDPGDGGLWCCVGGTATTPVGCGNPCYHQPSRWGRGDEA